MTVDNFFGGAEREKKRVAASGFLWHKRGSPVGGAGKP
jgi:hypothetical protein